MEEGKIMGGKTQGNRSISQFAVEKHARSKQITQGKKGIKELTRIDRRLLAKPNGKFQLVNGCICKITKH